MLIIVPHVLLIFAPTALLHCQIAVVWIFHSLLNTLDSVDTQDRGLLVAVAPVPPWKVTPVLLSVGVSLVGHLCLVVSIHLNIQVPGLIRPCTLHLAVALLQEAEAPHPRGLVLIESLLCRFRCHTLHVRVVPHKGHTRSATQATAALHKHVVIFIVPGTIWSTVVALGQRVAHPLAQKPARWALIVRAPLALLQITHPTHVVDALVHPVLGQRVTWRLKVTGRVLLALVVGRAIADAFIWRLKCAENRVSHLTTCLGDLRADLV
mmetsp:Transcript_40668/g.105139  ORF Transcript_40668/g.105139 Transcript_40668/m.105139 type:complete len:265 (-) Transcript_40668:1588-2382(-)